MESKTIVVVGGVAGGMSFATRYRRLNQQDTIIVLDKGPYVSFANCGLPYYISQEISDRSDLIVAEKEMLEHRFQLDIRTDSEVTGIFPEAKEIEVFHREEHYRLKYDELVLSMGAKPIRLEMDGIAQSDHVFTLRNIPDVDQIKAYLDQHPVKHAVIIGAGFIGMEMVEGLAQRQIHVSVVEKAPQVLPPLDEEMAAFAQAELIRNGVDVYVNTTAKSIRESQVQLEDGTVLPADLVIFSIGVQPENSMALEAGIETGLRGAIRVDSQFRTSIAHIYAVGDGIVVPHFITGQDSVIALASPANRQGRQLADILSGFNKHYRGTLGTSIVRLFDLSIASTGLNERQLKDKYIEVMHLLGNDHAGYFPGTTPIHLKVIFDAETGQIYGAQGVGAKGIDKRIDVIATAIKGNIPIQDLQELELAYAPPFGSAKDIVNMAGYVGENIRDGKTHLIQWSDLRRRIDEGYMLLDVRREDEVRTKGIIKGALHIPLDELRCRASELDRSKPVIVYCHSSIRSYNAEQILQAMGFDAFNLDGSFALYSIAHPEEIEHHV